MRLPFAGSIARPASAAAGVVCALLAGACDPVRDAAVDALGPEAPGVRQGPLHRPGQPCLLCHDGELGSPQRFTVAGTVYQTTGATAAAGDVTVLLEDAVGLTASLPTNAAGNFYATPETYDPTFPLRVKLQSGTTTVIMQTLVGDNATAQPGGACATCHFDPAGRASPGHVAVLTDDGGTPP